MNRNPEILLTEDFPSIRTPLGIKGAGEAGITGAAAAIASAIDAASDRGRFEDLAAEVGIPLPPAGTATTAEEALQIADNIGYPVLVRPSYVLGGRAMEIIQNASELVRYFSNLIEIGGTPGQAILVDRYLDGIEVEVDAVPGS